MDIIKIAAFAIICIMLLGLLRQYAPSIAAPAAVACCAMLLLLVLQAVSPILEYAQKLSAYTEWGDFESVCKAVAITLIAQTAQDLCRESGHTALAGQVNFAGKVAVLIVALPLFATLSDTLLGLLR